MIQALESMIAPEAACSLRRQTGSDQGFIQALFVARRWQEVSAAPNWSDAQRRDFLLGQAELQSRHYAQYYPAADFLILVHEQAPIGRLCVHQSESEVRIVDIALLPKHQNQGLGSALLHGVLALADRQQKACGLSVEQLSPARRLYERLGFRALDEQGFYIQMQRPFTLDAALTTPSLMTAD